MTGGADRTPRTLWQVITCAAQENPDGVAVVCDDHQITYARLHRESNRTAHSLLARGLGPGSRIAYVGRDSEFYYEILFACAKSGTVLVPINWRLTGTEMAYQLEDSEAAVVFTEGEFRTTVESACTSISPPPTVIEIHGSDLINPGLRLFKKDAPHHDFTPREGPDTPIIQLYTSGTTGTPKGVVLAERSFFAVRDALRRGQLDWLDWRSADKTLIGVPGFHIGGVWLAVQSFIAGATLVVMRAFSAKEAITLVRDQRITVLCVVPAMLRLLLAEPGAKPAGVRTVRKLVYGGSPISTATLEKALSFFRGEFAQIYGLTETGNTALCLPPADHKPGSPRLKSAGVPYPGFDVKVVDGEGTRLPPGAVGEICVSTPAAMLGYWKMPDATREVSHEGWLRTGDAGYLDDDGYLFIHDRIKDVIIVAGENVYPAEVEAALGRHPAVAEAAVIGVPDPRWGERVHACVVVEPGLRVTPLDLRRELTGRIADFKIPTSFEFLDRLPRTPSGKIQRRKLRGPHWSGRDREVN